jgi:hypothetical protein
VSASDSKVYVTDCTLGKGVFAAVPIRRGEVIFTFEGRVISLEEVLAKGEQQSNPIQIGAQTYLDIESPGVYINHSCDPNAGIRNDTILVALRDIARDEQICFDYSTSMSENLWTMECKCFRPQCRGLIQDFHYLPEELKARYLSLGIVQTFIVWQWRETPKRAANDG